MNCIRPFKAARVTATLLVLLQFASSLLAQAGVWHVHAGESTSEPFRSAAAEKTAAGGNDAVFVRAQPPDVSDKRARVSLAAAGNTLNGSLPAGGILRVKLEKALKASRLRPGSTIDGTLLRTLYLPRGCEAILAGSSVHLVIEKAQRVRPRGSRLGVFVSDIGRLYWSQRIPERDYAVSFRAASLTLPNGRALPIKVSFLQAIQPAEVRAGVPNNGPDGGGAAAPAQNEELAGTALKRQRKKGPSVLLLELEEPVSVPSPPYRTGVAEAGAPKAGSISLQPGTRAHLLLLNTISASKNRVGDTLQARLEEPIPLGDGVVLPEGFLFQGRVTKLVPPRRLNRPGSVRLNFDRMVLPGSSPAEVATSLTAAELNNGAGIKMDAEGTLQAPGRSLKQLALQFGVGAITGKAADDLGDMVIKFTVGGSNATLTRFIGIGTALAYFFAHRGNDIVVSKYSELEVTFDRPALVPLPQ